MQKKIKIVTSPVGPLNSAPCPCLITFVQLTLTAPLAYGLCSNYPSECLRWNGCGQMTHMLKWINTQGLFGFQIFVCVLELSSFTESERTSVQLVYTHT